MSCGSQNAATHISEASFRSAVNHIPCSNGLTITSRGPGDKPSKKILYPMISLCMLLMPFTAVAQAADNMKQDQ